MRAKGTLVVVPAPSYGSDVLVGEITGPPSLIRIDDYPGEDIPARPVKWIGKKRKGSLSAELIERLKHRSPLTILEASLVPEIVAAGVDQYYIDGKYTARLSTTKPDFSILDDYDLQTLFNYIAGVLAMIEDEVQRPAGTVSLIEAVAYLRENRGSIPEFTSNINSPGFLRLFAATTTPIVTAVLLSIALAGAASAAAADPGSIHVRNTKGPDGDSCPMVVQEQVRSAVTVMRLEDLKAVCEQAQAVHRETGAKTSVTTRIRQRHTRRPRHG